MNRLNINLPARSNANYSICIGTGILEKIAQIADISRHFKISIITDESVAPLYLKQLQSALKHETTDIILPPGEDEKNIENVQEIWKTLLENDFDRHSLVINLGGGVICDLGGFAASTYMRGIDFLQIPTSLLAQVDAGIGGKVGINFGGINHHTKTFDEVVKNSIGAFQQPIGVICDINTLKTLPDREFNAGFAEIIKHGLVKDAQYFEKVTAKKPRDFSEDELIDIVTTSCNIKKAIVEEDEREKGLRKILNFGHTIGTRSKRSHLTPPPSKE